MKRKSAAILLLLCMMLCLVGCVLEESATETTSFSYITSSKSETPNTESKNTNTESTIQNKDEAGTSKPTTDDDSDKTSSTSSKKPSQQQTESKSPSITIPEKEETGKNLVWVPVNGGKKYHKKSSCSNMKDPMQVTKETAIENGYGPCGKCY